MKRLSLKVESVNIEQWQALVAEQNPNAQVSANMGLCWAQELAPLQFTGPGAVDFLQGYLTSDTELLQPGTLQPTALCNLKGRVVANGWATRSADDSVWLLVHQSLAQATADFLAKYLVFAKAELTLCNHTHVVLAGCDIKPIPDLDTLLLSGPLAAAWWLAIAPITEAGNAWASAATDPGLLDSAQRFTQQRIAQRQALVTAQTSEQFLPQMLALEQWQAIDFNKGCYLGQEIVARAQHRGSVKRTLALLRWQPEANQGSPDPLTDTAALIGLDLVNADGKSQGAIVDMAEVPAQPDPNSNNSGNNNGNDDANHLMLAVLGGDSANFTAHLPNGRLLHFELATQS